ncbi:MAG: cytochrome c [Pseudomonadota bacterium]
MTRFLTLTLSACAALGVAASAVADGHSNLDLEGAVKSRKSVMTLVSYHTGVLGDMAKGEAPYDAEIAVAAAENLAAAASMNRVVLYPAGTEQGAIAGSRAKAEIWSDPTGYDQAATTLQVAATDMVVAAGTDLEALRGAMGAVGSTCRACHEAYRGPRN